MSPKVSEKHLRRRRVPHLVCLTFRSIAGDQARVVLAHRAHAATNHSWLTSESVKCRRVGIELMQPRPRPEPADEPDQTMLREALSSPRTLHGRDVRLVTVGKRANRPRRGRRPRPTNLTAMSAQLEVAYGQRRWKWTRLPTLWLGSRVLPADAIPPQLLRPRWC